MAQIIPLPPGCHLLLYKGEAILSTSAGLPITTQQCHDEERRVTVPCTIPDGTFSQSLSQRKTISPRGGRSQHVLDAIVPYKTRFFLCFLGEGEVFRFVNPNTSK